MYRPCPGVVGWVESHSVSLRAGTPSLRCSAHDCDVYPACIAVRMYKFVVLEIACQLFSSMQVSLLSDVPLVRSEDITLGHAAHARIA